jgi:hypothetical protein
MTARPAPSRAAVPCDGRLGRLRGRGAVDLQRDGGRARGQPHTGAHALPQLVLDGAVGPAALRHEQLLAARAGDVELHAAAEAGGGEGPHLDVLAHAVEPVEHGAATLGDLEPEAGGEVEHGLLAHEHREVACRRRGSSAVMLCHQDRDVVVLVSLHDLNDMVNARARDMHEARAKMARNVSLFY